MEVDMVTRDMYISLKVTTNKIYNTECLWFNGAGLEYVDDIVYNVNIIDLNLLGHTLIDPSFLISFWMESLIISPTTCFLVNISAQLASWKFRSKMIWKIWDIVDI